MAGRFIMASMGRMYLRSRLRVTTVTLRVKTLIAAAELSLPTMYGAAFYRMISDYSV